MLKQRASRRKKIRHRPRKSRKKEQLKISFQASKVLGPRWSKIWMKRSVFRTHCFLLCYIYRLMQKQLILQLFDERKELVGNWVSLNSCYIYRLDVCKHREHTQYHCYVNIILIACYSWKSHLHKAKCINLLMAPYFKDLLSKEIPFIYSLGLLKYWRHVLLVMDFFDLQ